MSNLRPSAASACSACPVDEACSLRLASAAGILKKIPQRIVTNLQADHRCGVETRSLQVFLRCLNKPLMLSTMACLLLRCTDNSIGNPFTPIHLRRIIDSVVEFVGQREWRSLARLSRLGCSNSREDFAPSNALLIPVGFGPNVLIAGARTNGWPK